MPSAFLKPGLYDQGQSQAVASLRAQAVPSGQNETLVTGS